MYVFKNDTVCVYTNYIKCEFPQDITTFTLPALYRYMCIYEFTSAATGIKSITFCFRRSMWIYRYGLYLKRKGKLFSFEHILWTYPKLGNSHSWWDVNTWHPNYPNERVAWTVAELSKWIKVGGLVLSAWCIQMKYRTTNVLSFHCPSVYLF